MEIEHIKITDLKPAEYNPRRISDEDYQKLKNSISTFGLVDPIIVNLKNMHIVGGHQRYDVLLDEHMLDNDFMAELPMIRLGDVGFVFTDTELSIRDDDHEKALNLALNKISGEWDELKLQPLLEELELSPIDIQLTGFSEPELEELNIDTTEETGERVVEDDYVEPEELEVTVKKGDIYKLGNHRLMCGDSTNDEDIKKLMNNQKSDMIFTDPPWNVNYGAVKPDNLQGYRTRKILNDSMTSDQFKEFLTNIFTAVKEILHDGAITYVVMPAQEWGNIMNVLSQCEFHWSSTIIWVKDRLILSRKDYHTQYEPIWYGWLSNSRRLHPLKDRKQSDVWEIPHPTKSEEHPTMKPIELCARAITNSTDPNNNVIDIFGGSGSTLIACEQTNRNCYMMELSPHYCQVIINRWETFTGKKAEKIN